MRYSRGGRRGRSGRARGRSRRKFGGKRGMRVRAVKIGYRM